MPQCPSCGGAIAGPSKTWTYLAAGEGGSLVKREVGVFECGRCGTKFPLVAGRQPVMIVPVEKIKALKDSLEEAKRKVESLVERLGSAEQENVDLRKGLEALRQRLAVAELEIKTEALAGEVNALKEKKWGLEELLKVEAS